MYEFPYTCSNFPLLNFASINWPLCGVPPTLRHALLDTLNCEKIRDTSQNNMYWPSTHPFSTTYHHSFQ
jgi:hypothetical protein